jgi:hypothetical protein
MNALALLLLISATDEPQIRAKSANGFVEVVGLPAATEEAAKRCRIVVDGTAEELAKRPAVAGTWSVAGQLLRFEPQFPLVPGVRYRITGDFPKPILFTIPKPPPGPPVSIAAVFPSANVLPENTLRFYVHFSGQMTRGDIYRHVKLIRDDGVEVTRPFLELDEELWSSDGLRVTMLFHPGRVKRELVPREEDGPILEEGRTFTLVFSRDWKDAEGRPLRREFRKTFSVGPPDGAAIDLGTWSLMPPRAGSDAPLILRLAKPLDHALLGSTIAVVDASGRAVPGETTVGGGERVVTFAPAAAWKAGAYRLVVDPRLEDVCGNRVGEPFEVDATKPRPKRDPAGFEKPFIVK